MEEVVAEGLFNKYNSEQKIPRCSLYKLARIQSSATSVSTIGLLSCLKRLAQVQGCVDRWREWAVLVLCVSQRGHLHGDTQGAPAT